MREVSPFVSELYGDMGKLRRIVRAIISEKEVQDAVLGVFKYDENIHLWRRNIGGANVANANGKKRFVRLAKLGKATFMTLLRILLVKRKRLACFD